MLLNFPSHGDAKKRCKVNDFIVAKQTICRQISQDITQKLPSQVQLASAKLAICLKNSIFGVEKLSFLRGLILSFRPTLRT